MQKFKCIKDSRFCSVGQLYDGQLTGCGNFIMIIVDSANGCELVRADYFEKDVPFDFMEYLSEEYGASAIEELLGMQWKDGNFTIAENGLWYKSNKANADILIAMAKLAEGLE